MKLRPTGTPWGRTWKMPVQGAPSPGTASLSASCMETLRGLVVSILLFLAPGPQPVPAYYDK